MRKKLHLENWSLCLEGKRIDGQEYPALILKNEHRTVTLEGLQLPKGNGNTVVKCITDSLEEYNLWNFAKRILACTTSANIERTRQKNSSSFHCKDYFLKRILKSLQFITCQYHILHRVLRVIMDNEIGEIINFLMLNIIYREDSKKIQDNFRQG